MRLSQDAVMNPAARARARGSPVKRLIKARRREIDRPRIIIISAGDGEGMINTLRANRIR